MRQMLVSCSALACASLCSADAAAQSLEARMLDAATAVVRMSFPARADICGEGRNGGRFASDRNWQYACEDGPVRVQLEKEGGRVVAVRAYVGGAWRPRDEATDLGEVSAAAASHWLLELASTAAVEPATATTRPPAADAYRATPDAAADAITAAVMADAADPWQQLLELARDRRLAERVRERAIFWTGQSAAREATSGLSALIESDTENTDIQKAAVFALSRRDDPGRTDQLMRVARTHPNPEVVKAAFFWLAESGDERVLDFFEEVLL